MPIDPRLCGVVRVAGCLRTRTRLSESGEAVNTRTVSFKRGYVERVLTPLAAAVGAGIAGFFLARAACSLAASDAGPDWRGRGRRFRLWVSVLVIAGSMVSAAMAAALAPAVPFAFAAASFAALGPGLAVVDVAVRRLPFLYTGVGIAIAVLALSFTPDLGRSLAVAFAVAVAMIALSLVSKGGAGGGDVVVAPLASLALTWAAGWLVTAFALVAAMFLTGMVGLVAKLLRGDGRLPPYGPSLLACWWLAYPYSIVDLLGK
jgi:hypothetical protein